MKQFNYYKLHLVMLFYAYFLNLNTTAMEAKVKKNGATWTILNYIEADNNLGAFAAFNIKAMQSIGSTPEVAVLVQLDEPQHAKTWRYKIAKNGISHEASLDQEMGVDHEQELIDAVRWAKTDHPSRYFMLTLWNHGNGILDEPKASPRGFNKKTNATKGILYDYSLETYLNNQQLDRALATIKSQILGKNIDIIGMDACLMAMVEVAYQIKEYANFLVASENLERAPGWNYADLLEKFTTNKSKMNPENFAKTIVFSFAALNKYSNQTYTQSAIYLQKIHGVKEGIDKVLMRLAACKSCNAQATRRIIKTARKKTLEFDQGKYIDLYSFYTQLQEEARLSKNRSTKDDNYCALLQKLQQTLRLAKKRINTAICANLTGSRYALAGGLSIYFPRQPIHASYKLTKFSQDSRWLEFIQKNHRLG